MLAFLIANKIMVWAKSAKWTHRGLGVREKWDSFEDLPITQKKGSRK
jgi:hypothetical protein